MTSMKMVKTIVFVVKIFNLKNVKMDEICFDTGPTLTGF